MTKKIAASLIFVLLVISMTTTIFADISTTYTYTIGVMRNWIRTQGAYMPGAILMRDVDLRNPEDLVVHNGYIYVADTGNRRIVAYNHVTGEYETFGEDVLHTPRGLFVTPEGHVYVACQNGVFAFDLNRELYLQIGRPTNPIFSERSIFLPQSVVVNRHGTIFVAGQGAFEGLMMFTPEGEFLGYFGANPRELSFMDTMRDLLDTEAQRERRLLRNPLPVSDIAIGPNGLIYTITATPFGTNFGMDSDLRNSIRILNMAGDNILMSQGGVRMIDQENFNSIAVSPRGFVFAATPEGVIVQYNAYGEVIFSFGGRALSSDRVGIFSVISSLYVDENDHVFVLDRVRNQVQAFYPTAFAIATHDAIEAFETGDYESSLVLWEELLVLNGMSRLAHDGRGRALFALGRHDEAREHFRFTHNRPDYSEAFWEMRDQWIAQNSAVGAFIIIIVSLVLYILSKWNKKTGIVSRTWDKITYRPRNNRLCSDMLYLFKVLRRPIDSYYDLKIGKHGSVLSASIIYLLAFAVFFMNMWLTSFLFGWEFMLTFISPTLLMIGFFVPLFLWVVANYLISTINEGEGSFKNVYVGTAYAFAPYIIFMPFLILISYVLTLNESFIFQIYEGVVIVWTALYFILMVLEMHRFTFLGMVRNVLLTFFAIMVGSLGVLFVFLFASQVTGFGMDIFREVFFRAF